ncbi:MAG: SDR family oxidoreductase [Clostridia bacterium]|nr:SDR family oxidoreductase [Clostridia bacterium]
MKLTNKTVMITGADGGMGMVICRALAEEGANLALCSVNGAHLDEVVAALRADFPACRIVSAQVDVTDEAQVAAFVEKAAAEFGTFDRLINLAGLSIPSQYKETEEATYDAMMDVNVKGSFFMSKHFAAHAANPARIINVGSMAARNTNANAPIYCMAKAAVNKLSEGLLLQLGKQGVTVSTVNPGGADTPFWGTRAVDRSKLMSAEDVAEVILFVAHLADHIQLHSVDFESAAKFFG